MTDVKKEKRVRFAPSPTGGLHPGNARIAVFNWLYAKRYKAKYVLRIEDTDEERSTDEFEKAILEDLTWLGITWDEGPFRQSDRFSRYKEVAEDLLRKGFLYKCYCTSEELEAMRAAQIKASKPPRYDGRCKNISLEEKTNNEKIKKPYTLRFDVEKFILETNSGKDQISYHDLIKNKGTTESITNAAMIIGDFVVMKQSGVPTYNFAVVVDDIDMKITHIFRGEDHISNTFRQIMIFKAMGIGDNDLPEYGHLPMLLAPDKTKLSKRSGGIPIHEYKDMGFVSEAMFNHLAFLGGGFRGVDEISSRDELSKSFNYEETAVSACVYDVEKLKSINSKIIQMVSAEHIIKILNDNFNISDDWKKYYNAESFSKIVAVSKDGVKTLVDIIHTIKMFTDVSTNEDMFTDFGEEQKKVLNQLFDDYVSKGKKICGDNWKDVKSSIVSSATISGGKLFKTIRVILTGRKDGPPLDDIMFLMSEQVAQDRIKDAKKFLG